MDPDNQTLSSTHPNVLNNLDVSDSHEESTIEQLSSKIKLLKEELIKVKVDRDHWSSLAKQNTVKDTSDESEVSSDNTSLTRLEEVNQEKDRLKAELKRLKDHLIIIEEEYTTEILSSEEKIKQLQEELKNYLSTIERLKQTIKSNPTNLEEQLNQLKKERDKALNDCSLLDDKVHRLNASIANLQLAIEQLQKENDKKIQLIIKQHSVNIENERTVINDLKRKIKCYEQQSEQTCQALEAASRLTERIDKKEMMIEKMKEELSSNELKMNKFKEEMAQLKSSNEGKVDKQIIKNLVLGYFSTAGDKKREVERLLARILDFNQEEMAKAGLSFNKSLKTPEGSLSSAFVQFLESESKPKPTPSPISVTKELAKDLTKVALSNNSKSDIFFDSTYSSNSKSQAISSLINSPSSENLFTSNSSTPIKPIVIDSQETTNVLRNILN